MDKKPEKLPDVFAPEKKKAKIDPSEFLHNPAKAFVLAEILRQIKD